MPVTLAGAVRARDARVAIHENVRQMPPILDKVLGDTHRIYTLDVGPEDAGYECIAQRRRTYRIMPQKRVRMAGDPA